MLQASLNSKLCTSGGAVSSEIHPFSKGGGPPLPAEPRRSYTRDREAHTRTAMSGQYAEAGLAWVWTAPHLGMSFPSWACEPDCKPRGHWKLWREERWHFTTLRNGRRWLQLRSLFPAHVERTSATLTPPKAQVPRTVGQQRPACKGWSLGVR